MSRLEARPLWFACTVIVAATLALPSTVLAAPPAHRIHLALGDSLAVGSGASDPARTGYVPLLFDRLRTPGRWRVGELVNVAAVGETTTSVLGGQLERARRVIADRRSDVRLVTIDIGANDILGDVACREDPVACGIEDRYLSLLSDLRNALRNDPGPEAVVLMAYMNPYSGTGLPGEALLEDALVGADGRIDCSATGDDVGLNDIIACVGRRFGALIVDMHQAGAGRGFELTHIAIGDLHFNDAGYALAADRFAGVLRRGAQSSR